MKDYEQATYGDKAARFYDRMHQGVLTTDESVSTLAELAGAGPVLELGVGTGRLAIALADLGLEVDGVDISPQMIETLKGKPGGDRVGTILGDIANLAVDRDYRLVFVAIDTLFLLSTQEEQVSCFQHVANHLTDDGLFVVDAFFPCNARAVQGGMVVRRVTADSVVFGASVHDPVQQTIEGQQILISEDGIKLAPGRLRYAWPAELDLMARLAGLRLRDRWGGWQREPFTASSARHVSIYTRVPEPIA